jgi:hypothetical protein
MRQVMPRYRNIVFLDHEETNGDNGELIQDEALRLLHHKTDDGVLWEVPTAESTIAAITYLLQWDCGEGAITGESGAGGSDCTETHMIYRDERGDWQISDRDDDPEGMYVVLTYNVGLSYIGLQEVLPD